MFTHEEKKLYGCFGVEMSKRQDENNFRESQYMEFQQKVEQLSEDSSIKKICKGLLGHIEALVEQNSKKYPPIYCFVLGKEPKHINRLDADIALVKAHSRDNQCEKFLGTQENDKHRKWMAGLFEIYVKATLLRCFGKTQVELDKRLANRRNCDVAITTPAEKFYIDATVRTGSEEERKEFDRHIENREGVWVTNRNPYYYCVQILEKVYDKLTNKNFDPTRSQLPDRAKNILLLSFPDAKGGPLTFPNPPRFSREVGWALDELFLDHPRGCDSSDDNDVQNHPPNSSSISLPKWLKYTANQRKNQGRLDEEKFKQNWTALLQAPKKISAIVLFSGNELIEARINYNASCKITHAEIAKFEKIFNKPPY